MPVVPPPLIALGAGVIQHRLAPGREASVLRKVVSAGVATASLSLLGATSAAFRRHQTTFEPFDPSKASTLVTEGPNAVTRNPMYVGMAGILVAHAIRRGGWLTPWPVAVFVGVVDRVQVRPEEAALQRIFGDAYTDYCARVPRWVGLPR